MRILEFASRCPIKLDQCSYVGSIWISCAACLCLCIVLFTVCLHFCDVHSFVRCVERPKSWELSAFPDTRISRIHERSNDSDDCKGGLFIFLCFFRGRFWIFFGFLVLCFPVSLIFCFSCFSAFLLFAFPASLLFLLFCFFLLLCFSASLFSLLLCFCTSVLFYLYYSTFSFLQSCIFAALLPAPLLLCFLSLLSLCF
jgi:hypothetical protein